VGATSQEGREDENRPEPDDSTDPEPDNAEHEHQVESDKNENKEWLTDNKYKRQKAKFKKQHINVVFNYSSIKLTQTMEKVLNRGLNFAILPFKLDLTQVLTDFKRFERTMIWKEFWFGRETDEQAKKPIFKSKKNNLPRNYKTPKQKQGQIQLTGRRT